MKYRVFGNTNLEVSEIGSKVRAKHLEANLAALTEPALTEAELAILR